MLEKKAPSIVTQHTIQNVAGRRLRSFVSELTFLPWPVYDNRLLDVLGDSSIEKKCVCKHNQNSQSKRKRISSRGKKRGKK